MVDLCRRCVPRKEYPNNTPDLVILVMAAPRTNRWITLKEELEKLSTANFDGIGIELLQNSLVPQVPQMGSEIQCEGPLGFLKLKPLDAVEPTGP
jgi:hypothetical protein